jgi:hypothetical protein
MKDIIDFTPGNKTTIINNIHAPDFELRTGDVVEFIKSEPVVDALRSFEEEQPNGELIERKLIAVYLKLIQCDEVDLVGEVGWFCADELTGELLSC